MMLNRERTEKTEAETRNRIILDRIVMDGSNESGVIGRDYAKEEKKGFKDSSVIWHHH